MKRAIFFHFLLVIGITMQPGICHSQSVNNSEESINITEATFDTMKVKTIYAETIHTDALIIDSIKSGKKTPSDSICSCTDTMTINNNTWSKPKFEVGGYIFSDLVGISDDQPNGLLQTNVYFSYTRPVKLYNSEKVCKRSHFGRNVVLLDLTISKIGIQNYALPVRYDYANDTAKFVNRFDLVQYANVFAATKLNIYTLKWHKVLTIYADFIPVLYNTSLSDTLTSQNDISVSNVALGLNFKGIIEPDKISGLSAEFSYSIYRPVMYSDYYDDRASYQLKEPYDGNTVSHDRYSHFIQVIDWRIMHKPKEAKLSSYLRFSIVGNFIKKPDVPRNIFYQFQIGASFNFSSFDLFKKSVSD